MPLAGSQQMRQRRADLSFFEEQVDPNNGGPPQTRWNVEESPAGVQDSWNRGGGKRQDRESWRGNRDKESQKVDKEEREGQWSKNRNWKVVNLTDAKLAVVNRPDPFAPKSDRLPPEDLVVRWLENGDEVEQTGHSKKTRGFMVMPVRIKNEPTLEGWVVRRVADKDRDRKEAWFEEITK